MNCTETAYHCTEKTSYCISEQKCRTELLHKIGFTNILKYNKL